MSILIKGMEMPKDCRECPLCNYHIETGETWCVAIDGLLATDYGPILFDGRDSDCPLVEIPAHGRLVDADALMQTYCRHEFSSDMGDAMEILENYPTVIEAEEDQV